jgi:hypothetical protein
LFVLYVFIFSSSIYKGRGERATILCLITPNG